MTDNTEHPLEALKSKHNFDELVTRIVATRLAAKRNGQVSKEERDRILREVKEIVDPHMIQTAESWERESK